jgi:hypothetical protein
MYDNERRHDQRSYLDLTSDGGFEEDIPCTNQCTIFQQLSCCVSTYADTSIYCHYGHLDLGRALAFRMGRVG